MNRPFTSLVLLLCCLYLFAPTTVSAQISSVIVRVNVPLLNQGQPIPVGVEFTPTANVQRVMFYFRPFGESEFRPMEMLLSGSYATLTLSGEYALPPYIEYYVEVEMTGGRTETYPLQNPQMAPLKATVRPSDPKDQEARILSPEQGETVAAEDVVIAVSLFYASDEVNRRATKLLLNGVDVTAQSVFSDDVILYSPKNFPRPLNPGVQFIRVELYDKQGKLYHTIESNFALSTAMALAEQVSRFQAGIEGQLEYRREDIAKSTNDYFRGQFRLNGSYRSLMFGGNAFVTSEEKAELQPQNRLLLTGDLDWLKFQLGDAFPKFPSYIVSGKRVRGVSGSLNLKFFNVDVSVGQTTRAVDGILSDRDTTFADSSSLNARPQNTVLKSGFTYTPFQPGTYTRDFLAVRPSFGSGENFQLGFTYLHSKDDQGSIRYGVNPNENLVVGSDFLLAFNNQRFRLETQASLSLTNRNIARGNFTQADYDKLAGKDDPNLNPTDRAKRQKDSDDIKKLADFGQQFITINEFLFPLNPVGTGLPGVAYEGTLTLNYFNNFIRAQAYQRGAAYVSFGNEFLQSDIQAFSISDRIRMFQNRVLFSVSYEQRKDNTASTKVATTTYDNLLTSVTIFPGTNLPSFTIGYGINNRKSDVAPTDEFKKLFVADDATNRYSIQLSHDFTLGGRHSLLLGANIADKKDNTFNKRDQTNNTYFGSLTTQYSFPLQTTLSVNVNQTKSQQLQQLSVDVNPILVPTEFNLTAVSLNIQYRLMDDKLRIGSLISPTFGDLNRTLAQASLDYTISDRHSLLAQYDFIQNAGFQDDSIASLIYRFSF